MAVSMLTPPRRANAEPGDVFVVAAPAVTQDPPKAADISVGDASVSSQTGALNYSYALKVPPGRNGMAPSLRLAYSSQSPIFGTVANGWSLVGIPLIELDTSEGRIAPSAPTYTSSLSGGRPLVQVDEPGLGDKGYRAQNDASWIRYEQFSRMPYWWKAMSPDGTTHFFGHTDAHTTGCTNISPSYAPLTQTVDKFGNQIDDMYEAGFAGECRIAAITWGQNRIDIDGDSLPDLIGSPLQGGLKSYDLQLSNAAEALERALRDQASTTAVRQRADELEKALRRVPAVMTGDRGHGLVALVAEVRGEWKKAVEARRMQIAHFAFMRELAEMQTPMGRRTILRDYNSRRVAEAYRRLSQDLRMLNDLAAAKRASKRARMYE